MDFKTSKLSGRPWRQVPCLIRICVLDFCQLFHLLRPAVSIFKVSPGMWNFIIRECMKWQLEFAFCGKKFIYFFVNQSYKVFGGLLPMNNSPTHTMSTTGAYKFCSFSCFCSSVEGKIKWVDGFRPFLRDVRPVPHHRHHHYIWYIVTSLLTSLARRKGLKWYWTLNKPLVIRSCLSRSKSKKFLVVSFIGLTLSLEEMLNKLSGTGSRPMCTGEAVFLW